MTVLANNKKKRGASRIFSGVKNRDSSLSFFLSLRGHNGS
jgi:hypothetical protein